MGIFDHHEDIMNVAAIQRLSRRAAMILVLPMARIGTQFGGVLCARAAQPGRSRCSWRGRSVYLVGRGACLIRLAGWSMRARRSTGRSRAVTPPPNMPPTILR